MEERPHGEPGGDGEGEGRGGPAPVVPARDEVCRGHGAEHGDGGCDAGRVGAEPREMAECPEGEEGGDGEGDFGEGVADGGELVFLEEPDERACGADPVDFEFVDSEGAACAPAMRADGEAEIDVVCYFESEELVRVDGVVCGA